MDVQPDTFRSHTGSRVIAVPLSAAGVGLRLLLKTHLVPVQILSLRFLCHFDGTANSHVRVVVSVDRTLAGFPCGLMPEIRDALEQCFRRFLIRTQRVPSGTWVDAWEWDSRKDVLIRRPQRGEATLGDPDG
jgi:hypothetical protein